MVDTIPPDAQRIDKTISFLKANIIALFLTFPAMAVLLVPFLSLWGVAGFTSLKLPGGLLTSTPDFLLFIAILSAGLVMSVAVHEGLHALGFLWGGASRKDIRFGMKMGTPYAHCKAPLPVADYRLAGALPGVVLGLLPGLAGIITGNGWLLLYGMLLFVAAMGDAMILWMLRDAPENALVLDHPSRVGCVLILV